MTRTLFWWTPTRPLRALAAECLHNSSAWARLYVRRNGRSLSNFGDAVSPLIMRELTGHTYRWAPLRSAELVSVGSVLNAYAKVGSEAYIFGSGVRVEHEFKSRTRSIPSDRIGGVRGHHSAKTLGLSADRVIGDPALVVSELLPTRVHRRTGTRVLVLPHFATFGHRRAIQSLNALKNLGYEVILPNQDPVNIAGKIRGADLLITSSLHGIIFADSVNTPVTRVSFPDVEHENDFKYHDYESLYGRD